MSFIPASKCVCVWLSGAKNCSIRPALHREVWGSPPRQRPDPRSRRRDGKAKKKSELWSPNEVTRRPLLSEWRGEERGKGVRSSIPSLLAFLLCPRHPCNSRAAVDAIPSGCMLLLPIPFIAFGSEFRTSSRGQTASTEVWEHVLVTRPVLTSFNLHVSKSGDDLYCSELKYIASSLLKWRPEPVACE